MIALFITFFIPVFASVVGVMTFEWWLKFAFGFTMRPTTKTTENNKKKG